MIGLLKGYSAVFALLMISIGLALGLHHYLEESIRNKERAEKAEASQKSLKATLQDYQTKVKYISEIDEKYTQELTKKNADIEKLRDAVLAGTFRLHVKASCPSGVPKTSATASLANGASCELSPDARQDYYTLRSQLAQATAQINGLQAYIREITQ